MNYQETPPSPRFAGLVKCFWSLDYEQSGIAEPDPVVPDGSIEIIFNLSDRFRLYHPTGEIETQPASIVAGQMQTSILIGPSGNVRLFGIRFDPAGAFPFFRFEIKELLNRIEPLESIWSEVGEIEERLFSSIDFRSQVFVAEDILGKQLREKAVVDPWMRHSVNMICSSKGMLPVRTIARGVGMSERGIERRFTRFVGLTPKSFSRIVRFQSVLRSIKSASETRILDTALAFGYYDQSHLNNEFRQFSGTSPTVFLKRANRMTELFITTE